jgi:hypothetical protein
MLKRIMRDKRIFQLMCPLGSTEVVVESKTQPRTHRESFPNELPNQISSRITTNPMLESNLR